MSDVRRVIAQVQAPKPGDDGRVTYGYYRIDDGVLTMTDESGIPVRDRNGERVTHTLRPGDKETAIANALTLKVWRIRHDDNGGFNRPLPSPLPVV